MKRLLPALCAALTLTLAAGCGEDDPKQKPAADKSAGTQTSAAGCKQVDAPEPGEDGGAKKPKGSLDPKRTHTVTLTTSCGARGPAPARLARGCA